MVIKKMGADYTNHIHINAMYMYNKNHKVNVISGPAGKKRLFMINGCVYML